ncbi:MAG: M48 family metalloprotease [Deltaproteobacteria bacterium]|nr:M48 family metalloprotease [Deltaproteobacteria bacterium]
MKTRKSNHTPWGVRIGLCLLLCLSLSVDEVGALSTAEERVFGEEFLYSIRKQFEFVEDEFANDYINELGQHLLTSLDTKLFPYRFYIIRDNTLNAFAAPGGHIFFFSGLIEMMESVDQLAAVICHEIGHISARHLAQRIEQNKKIAIGTMAGALAGALLGGEVGKAVMVGSGAAGIQAQLNYSRDDERQADQLGSKYTYETGFNPVGMIETLKMLERGEWSGVDGIPPYLLTHPSGPERMANLEVLLSGYPPKPDSPKTVKFRRRFPFFKTILRAKTMNPDDAERWFLDEVEKHPDSVLAQFGLGVLWKEKMEYAKALERLKRAMSIEPESLPVLRHLGETYQFLGRDRDSVAVLEKALGIEGRDRAALALLAVSYQNLDEHDKAISLFERLKLMSPVRDDVFYNLGVSYGRIGRLALAHYNFGIYFRRRGEPDKARFHFSKAEELGRNDPALMDRVREALKTVSP